MGTQLAVAELTLNYLVTYEIPSLYSMLYGAAVKQSLISLSYFYSTQCLLNPIVKYDAKVSVKCINLHLK